MIFVDQVGIPGMLCKLGCPLLRTRFTSVPLAAGGRGLQLHLGNPSPMQAHAGRLSMPASLMQAAFTVICITPMHPCKSLQARLRLPGL